MVKEALHDTDRSAMLLILLLPESSGKRQNVVPEDDPFLKPEEWAGLAYSKNWRDAFGMSLQCVLVSNGFAEAGEQATRCCDMKGAVFHGLSERLAMQTFSFEDPTNSCEEFLDDVIRFAKHCLSRKRVKNAEAFLHPVAPDPVDANLAQVWCLERLAVAIFASVAPEPPLPPYTALGETLRLCEWDQEMLLGVQNGGKTRSVSHRPLVRCSRSTSPMRRRRFRLSRWRS